MFKLINKLFLFIFILFFFLIGTPFLAIAGDDRPKISSGELILPDKLDHYIKKNYPNLRMPTLKNMTGRWSGYIDRHSLPYGSWGDFNKNGLTDVALIVIEGDRWWIQVFFQTPDNSYNVVNIDRFHGDDKWFTSMSHNPPQGYVLNTLRAGEKITVDGTIADSSQLAFDTITLSPLALPSERMWVMQYDWDNKYNRFGKVRYHFRTLSDLKEKT